jgi:hypothetical protein
MWKLSRSGDDAWLNGDSDRSLHLDKVCIGSLTLRQVAKRARGARCGAKHADETDDIDDAREERELSVTMDSGDEADEVVDGAREGRRLGKWYASRPFLTVGLY